MLIFILQSVWLYIKELAGKDLELDVIFKFLIYVSPRIIVLVLPLTVLLSSIMVFGNFAEKYEFAAMKSTGISLQRAMRSVSIFIGLLAVITFFFANNIIPKAEFNFYNLRKNIAKVKPAFAIAEGQFNDLGNLNIKVDKKSGDRGQFLEKVLIHQKKSNAAGNHTVMISESGELKSEEDSDILQLILYNGHYYDEVIPKDLKEREKKPHVKSYFETYTINVDLGQINNVDFDQQNISNKYSMLDVTALDYTIDSLIVAKKVSYDDLSDQMYNRSTASTLAKNIDIKKPQDSTDISSVYELYQTRKKMQLVDGALNNIRSTLAILNTKKRTIASKEKDLNKHIIAFYEKFALAIVCIILFFVGAPLGALIKKGGFGLPIVIAIILFLTYHFIGIFAKNSAEDSSMNAILASWLSTLVMLPLSIYLTSRATKDRALINLDGILVPIKKLLGKRDDAHLTVATYLDVNSDDYVHLLEYSDKKLIDVVQNYRQFGLTQDYHYSALQILESRGITKEELRFGGNLVNEDYEEALRYKTSYDENSRMTLIIYFLAVVFTITGAILNNNGFPVLGKVILVIGIIFIVLYLIGYGKSLNNQASFYKVLEKNIISNAIAMIILGIPLYFIYNYYFKRKMANDINEIT